MDEAERCLFDELLSSLEELKKFLKCSFTESAKDMKFLKVPEVAKILHKNNDDTRELMKSKRFSICP